MSNIPNLEITEEGIKSPSYQEVLDGTLEDLNQAFGGTMDKDVTTPQGQIAVSMAWSINQKDQQLTYLASQFDPNFAEGRFQDALASIYFLERIPARGTAVTARCTGLVDTIIPKGSSAIDDAGYIYYSSSSATINSSGYADVIFVNQTTGPIACPAGSLNKIYKSSIGWDSVYNDTSGALGQDVESRNNFEYRRRNSVAFNSQNQNLSVQSAVLAVDDVVDAYVYSNDTGSTINYGETAYQIAPHSLLISVYGGDSKEVAQAIFNKKNPGCGMVGNVKETITITSGYIEPYPKYTITYLSPSPKPIKFRITIQQNELLPSDIDQQIKNAVISIFTGESGNSRARIGGLIHAGRYYTPVSNLSDYVNVESIEISKNGTTYSTSVTMGVDEMPVIDINDVEVIM
ncbi:putative phage protein gp47/JayE [Orbus hercynius]|uniref:Putative phage protein gp47/JayE n=1 Tax=Orbus hercynius TaxID=593135 RepID=A0A495RIT3_9GAMM|nr:baseplate J/gp47 family protein [Orbus hercynius]RKS87345.1 putative phage protein gp47/JayE [Orbus hercynius]